MRRKTILSISFLLIISTTLVTPQIIGAERTEQLTDITPKAVKNWTIMLYFCADTRDDYVTSNQDNSQNDLGKGMLEAFDDPTDFTNKENIKELVEFVKQEERK